jgi:DMSO/TMAO reductase YedYZ heme-binding membrane subunit
VLLTVGAILFVVLFLPLVRSTRWLERKLRKRGA